MNLNLLKEEEFQKMEKISLKKHHLNEQIFEIMVFSFFLLNPIYFNNKIHCN
jgi:hypothetical protein